MRCSCAAHTACDVLALSATMGRSWIISSLPCDSLSTTFFSVGWWGVFFFSLSRAVRCSSSCGVLCFRYQIIVLVLLQPKNLQLWGDRNVSFLSGSLPCSVMAHFFLKCFPLARYHAIYVIFFFLSRGSIPWSRYIHLMFFVRSSPWLP